MKLLPSKFNGKIFQISAVRTGACAYMDATPLIIQCLYHKHTNNNFFIIEVQCSVIILAEN